MLRFFVLSFLLHISVSAQSRLARSLINKDVQKEAELLIEQIGKQIKGDSSDLALVSHSRLNKASDCSYSKDGKPYTGWYYKCNNFTISTGMIENGKDNRLRFEFGMDKKIRSIKLIADSGICYNWEYSTGGNLISYSKNEDDFDCIVFDRLFGGSNTDGDYYSFYENGRLREKIFSRDKGHSTQSFYYYNNGKRKQIVFSKKGQPIGVWKQYNRRGRCIAKIYYRNGKPVKTKGEWKKWNELK
jgi:hypothetical protein